MRALEYRLLRRIRGPSEEICEAGNMEELVNLVVCAPFKMLIGQSRKEARARKKLCRTCGSWSILST